MGPAEPGPLLVLGTAGHIDHGKTALVRALTGIDTDRLPEEKARGITIELGFAPLDLPGGPRLAVVDVPGHEALVRTMVAGAAGIDLVLLVVAADEGVMPQTREHLSICELLGVARGVVALTKVDAAPADLASLAAAEVAGLLEGSTLAASPIVRCSAMSGVGLDELREALRDAAAAVTPRTPRAGPPRLPIDRSFAARGFGAVVTGTLVGGALAVGDGVEVLPGGARARVRGLQRHGESAQRLEPGVRCAVNLHGIELSELSRGMVLTRVGAFEPTTTLDVQLRWLEAAPASETPISVELLLGTAERRARVAPIGAPQLRPGTESFARIHVAGDPVPALPGDGFVLRGFARTADGGATLGGGRVLDIAPPRRRRSDPQLRAELEILAAGNPRSDCAVRISRAGLSGVTSGALERETGLADAALEQALQQLAADGEAFATSADRWIGAARLSDLERRLEEELDAFHRSEPLLPGMPAGALRGRLPENVPGDVTELVLTRLAAQGRALLEADLVRRPDHRPELTGQDRELADRILAEARRAALEPAGLREWCGRLGARPERMRDILAHLERGGVLVRAGDDLWFDREAVDALRDRVVSHLRQHGRLETAAYKTLIGTTRRTAVPLMQLFDDERVTVRRGDVRLLRGQ